MIPATGPDSNRRRFALPLSWKEICCIGAILALVPLCPLSPAGQISKFDRNHAQSMLREVSSDVQKHYYDPKFHGVDWESRVHEAEQNIDKTDSMDGGLTEIAAMLDS